ncbi:MAG TPA: hypothetical protein VF553_15810 [Pyrinomonadaceae bacterium]
MEEERVSLTIEGQPGGEVKVYPKDHGDAPPPPPYMGNLDADGRLTISLPPANYAVASPSHETQPVELKGGETERTVRLKEA